MWCEPGKEPITAEANRDNPVSKPQLEADIVAQQKLAMSETDPAKRVRIVGKIRELKNQLPS